MKSRRWFQKSALLLGFAFLYIPIIMMIVYSFNNSRLVTVWDAANSPTLAWYGKLFQNDQIMDAAWVSIQIAAMSATAAVILGRWRVWCWRDSVRFAAARYCQV